MRKKVAVVGDRDSVLVFKALGVDVFESIESTDARKTVDRLAKEDYGVMISVVFFMLTAYASNPVIRGRKRNSGMLQKVKEGAIRFHRP